MAMGMDLGWTLKVKWKLDNDKELLVRGKKIPGNYPLCGFQNYKHHVDRFLCNLQQRSLGKHDPYGESSLQA